MFLHVGGEVVVNLRRVVAIFNLRGAVAEDRGAPSLIRQLQAGRTLYDLAGENAKSLVLTDNALYLSPIHATTLKKRAETQKNLTSSLP
jgi:hypothetical protein